MDMAKDMGVISQRREKTRRKTFEEQHKAWKWAKAKKALQANHPNGCS
jgi:hypothetical protein